MSDAEAQENQQSEDESAPKHVQPEDAPKSHKGIKITALVMGILLAVLVLVYGIGAFFFSNHFFPRSAFGNQDVSLMPQDEFAALLADIAADYTLTVERSGFSLEVPGEQVDLSINAEGQARSAYSSQNIWVWPYEVFQSHDVSHSIRTTFSTATLNALLTEAITPYNEQATPSQDAVIVYDAATDKLVIQDEVYGTQINQNALSTKAQDCLTTLNPQCAVTSEELINPTLLASDSRLTQALKKVQAFASQEIPLTLNTSVPVGTITKDTILGWVVYDENLTPSLNPEAINAWVTQTTEGLNTVGTQRTYTRPDGKAITVKGGTYGWSVDTANLGQAILTNITAGNFAAIDIPTSHVAYAYSGVGKPDWGAYVDIDISEQMVRYYDAAGALLYSAPCVTGERGVYDTPTGIYSYNYDWKQSPGTLTGRNSDGSIMYRTQVAYWMPFVDNAIGLHDATWQSSFGGNRYDRGYGSHGCINLSLSDARWFYQNLPADVCVITHY